MKFSKKQMLALGFGLWALGFGLLPSIALADNETEQRTANTSLPKPTQIPKQVGSPSSGYTITSAPALRIACEKAYKQYQNDAQKLGKTECGAFIQGFVVGFGAGAIITFTRDPNTAHHLEILKKVEDVFCTRPSYEVHQYIEDFLSWSKHHPKYKDSPQGALLGSIEESCGRDK